MLSKTNTTTHSLISLLLLACSFVASVQALPTSSNTRVGTLFEPLFFRTAPQVGPARSIERLRQRAAKAKAATASTTKNVKAVVVGNPKLKMLSKREPSPVSFSPVSVPVFNPKLARRQQSPSLSTTLLNPKLKKRSPTATYNPKSLLAKRFSPVPFNPKLLMKRSYSMSTANGEPKVMLAKRSVAKVPANKLLKKVKAVHTPPTNPKILAARSAMPNLLSNTVVLNPKKRSLDITTEYAAAVSKRSLNNTRSQKKIKARSLPANTFAAVAPKNKRAFAPKIQPKQKAGSVSSTSSSGTIPKQPTTTSKPAPTTTTTTMAAPTTKTTTTVPAAATPTVSAPASNGWPSSGGMISAAYYPDWQGSVLPPNAINFDLFDLIDFAFALPTSTFDLEFTQDDSEQLLTELIQLAHGNNTKVLISIGGWTGSGLFSKAVSTSANRKTFIANILKMVNKFGADGVDIDWEYPGTTGAAGNIVSSSDSANFLLFLQGLRVALGSSKRISTCVTQTPYIGANGSPLTDVTAYANLLDNILVMNYDVWGASSNPGPNAPLEDDCANELQPNANQASAVAAWTAAGMPAIKILMGVPGYGYVSASTKTTLVHKRSEVLSSSSLSTTAVGMSNRDRASLEHAESQKSYGHRMFDRGQKVAESRRRLAKKLKRDARKQAGDILSKAKRSAAATRSLKNKKNKRDDPIVFCPGNHSGGPCPGVTGQDPSTIAWNPLNSTTSSVNGTNSTTPGVFQPGVGVGKLGQGDLQGLEGNQIEFYQLIGYGVLVKSGVNYIGTNGYTRQWDTCSSTPYLYDVSRKVVITYDDPESLGLKGNLAHQQGLGGLNMWEISGDTDDWELVQSFRSAMGLKPLGI